MKQRPRIYYTETDKASMWDRWQKGESLHSIARDFGRLGLCSRLQCLCFVALHRFAAIH